MPATLGAIHVSEDSRLEEGNPTTNYGSNSVLKCGSVMPAFTTTYLRPILHFDISSLPVTARIVEAILRLYVQTVVTGGLTVTAYRCTRTDWVESEVTWNEYKSGSNWTSGGGDYDAGVADVDALPTGTGWWEWSVLNNARDAHQNRSDQMHILIVPNSTMGDNRVEIRSKNYLGSTYTPEVELAYMDVKSRLVRVVLSTLPR